MSYCRFQNTLNDLRDCKNEMDDAYTISDMGLSNDERHAMIRLVNVCQEIIDNFDRMEAMEIETQEEDEDEDEEEETFTRI
jgi:hypothetical protein